jgi:hypothetical protein
MAYPVGTTFPGAMNPVGLHGQQFTGTPLINQSYTRPGMGMPPMAGVPRPGVVPLQGRSLGIGPMGMMAAVRTPGPSAAPFRGPPPANKRGPEALKSPTTSLDFLGQDMLQNQKQQQKQKQAVSPLPQSTPAATNSTNCTPTGETLLSLVTENTAVNQNQQSEWPLPQKTSTSTNSSTTDTLLSLGTDDGADLAATPLTRVSSEPEPLDNVFIPLDSVLPGK